MNNLITIKTFARAVTALATGGVKLNDNAHALGVFAMQHAKDTGDIRPMDKVYQAMQSGRLRAEGFRFWVEFYSPIKWDKDGKISLTKPNAKSFHDYNIEASTANPFWTLDGAAERPIKDFSIEILQAMLDKALKKAESLDENGQIVRKDGTVEYQAPADKVVQIKTWASDMRAKMAKAA